MLSRRRPRRPQLAPSSDVDDQRPQLAGRPPEADRAPAAFARPPLQRGNTAARLAHQHRGRPAPARQYNRTHSLSAFVRRSRSTRPSRPDRGLLQAAPEPQALQSHRQAGREALIEACQLPRQGRSWNGVAMCLTEQDVIELTEGGAPCIGGRSCPGRRRRRRAPPRARTISVCTTPTTTIRTR